MEKSVFIIKKMDCAAEENMVRMKLHDVSGIRRLDFDVPNRKLTIIHQGNLPGIQSSIDSLNFNSSLQSNEKVEDVYEPVDSSSKQARLLWQVLIVNFGFFVIELTTGLISWSMGLVADSLDMLADAIVYGLSLIAVGSTVARKKSIAGVSGYFQLALAAIGFIEVIRRFIGADVVPNFRLMISISFLALIANAICLYLLQRSKSNEAHMKASMIFTSNDVIINIGVIVAGTLVYLLNSKYPDLIVGTLVFVIVTRGAFKILKLAN